MAKYTDARYPEKINDLVNNDGTINMPDEGPIDNEAVAQEITEFIENLDAEEPSEAFDKVFKFDLATAECIKSAFDNLPLVYVIQELISTRKLYIVANLSGITWLGENAFDSQVTTSFSLEMDSETGSYKLLMGLDEEADAISGTIRFNFDPNRGN